MERGTNIKKKCVKRRPSNLHIYIPWGLMHPRFQSWEAAIQCTGSQGNWWHIK